MIPRKRRCLEVACVNGWIVTRSDDGIEKAARCAACLPTTEERLKSAGVPLHERAARFDEVDGPLRSTAQKVERFLTEWDPSATSVRILLVRGRPGVGKSWLLACAMRLFIERGKSVLWKGVKELLREICDTYDNATEDTESAYLRRIVNVDFLGLNDLHARYKATEHALNTTESIVDSRISAAKVTFITTNSTAEAIAEKYGERMRSRLGERFCRVIDMDEVRPRLPDFRSRRG